MQCLRCGEEMKHLPDEDIRLGRHSLISGDLFKLLAGSMPVRVFVCQKCNKLKFFYLD